MTVFGEWVAEAKNLLLAFAKLEIQIQITNLNNDIISSFKMRSRISIRWKSII